VAASAAFALNGITAARQKDLDRKQLAAGVLFVQSKTAKKVNIPAAGSFEENIETALKIAPQVRQYVIVNRAGKPYTRDGFQTQWKRAMTKAFPNKADRFTFHDIRAKSLSDADTLEAARVRAGHSDAEITKRVYRRLPDVATVADISHLKRKKMTRLIALLCLLSATAASAGSVLDGPKVDKDGTPIGDRPVLIFVSRGARSDFPDPAPANGTIVPLTKVLMILYVDIPCQMPIQGRENMYRYADAADVGCWAPTVGGGYETIHEIDGISHQNLWLASAFQTAVFQTKNEDFQDRRPEREVVHRRAVL